MKQLALSFYLAFALLAPRAADHPFPQYRHRSWTSENGLPHVEVGALLQNRQGYLWIGTRGGLLRFDGVRFESYSKATHPEFTSDQCIALAEDTEGSIWLSTSAEVLRIRGDVIKRMANPPHRAGLNMGGVWASPKAGLWIRAVGLWKYRDGSFVQIYAPPYDTFAYSFLARAGGEFVVGTTHGLIALSHSGVPTHHYMTLFPSERDLVDFRCLALTETDDGNLLILGQRPKQDARLVKFDGRNWTFHPVGPLHNTRGAFFFAKDAGGRIWLNAGTNAIGIYAEDRLIPAPIDFPADDVPLCMVHDREGNVWVGGERSGLHCYNPLTVRSLTKEDGLPHEEVTALAQSTDGTIYIGTEGGTAAYTDRVLTNYTISSGLIGNEIRALALDAENTLWAGTRMGVSAVRPNQPIRSWKLPMEWYPTADSDRIGGNKFRSISFISPGEVLAGTDRGLFNLRADGTHSRFPDAWFAEKDCTSLLVEFPNQFWLNVPDHGLVLSSNTQVLHFSRTNGLTANSATCALRDAAGDLWVGTENGLNMFREGRIHAFTTAQGLPHREVRAVLEDDRRKLWISQPEGVYSVSKRDFEEVISGRKARVQPQLFDEADGMPSSETAGRYSNPKALKTLAGELWFATCKGVAIFDSKPSWGIPPIAVVEEVRANDRIIHSGPSGMQTDQTDEEQVPSLAPGTAGILEFRFSAPSFVAAEKVRFKFRLEGYDKEWREAGTRRVAHYTNLSPRKYRFQVLACNHRNVWGTIPASFAFVIQPFYFQRPAFWFACAGMGILALSLVHRQRVSHHLQLERVEKQLALANERVRIARDLHDGIGNSLTQLRLLSALAERDPSMRSSPLLGQIQAAVQQIGHSLRETIWLAREESLGLEGLVSRACEHAEALGNAAGFRCKFILPAKFPALTFSQDHAQHLYYALREAIGNAAKHSKLRELQLRVSLASEELLVEVRDDGCGFDPANARRGEGLENLRSRLHAMGGAIAIDSSSSGTSIGMKIPLKAPGANLSLEG